MILSIGLHLYNNTTFNHSGMNVLLDSGEVALYLASHSSQGETYAWILRLEPYSGPPAPSKQKVNSSSYPSKKGSRKSQRLSKTCDVNTSSSCRSSSSSSSSSSSRSCSSKSNDTSHILPSMYHPFAKLPWFKRRQSQRYKKYARIELL